MVYYKKLIQNLYFFVRELVKIKDMLVIKKTLLEVEINNIKFLLFFSCV